MALSIRAVLCSFVCALASSVAAQRCELQLNRSVVLVTENQQLVEPCNTFTVTFLHSFNEQQYSFFSPVRLLTSLDVAGQLRQFEQQLDFPDAQEAVHRVASAVLWRQISTSSYLNYESVQSLNVKVSLAVLHDSQLLAYCNSSFTILVLNINEYRPVLRAVRVNGSRVATARKELLEFSLDCLAYRWTPPSLVGTVLVLEARDDDVADLVSFQFKLSNFSLPTSLSVVQFTHFGHVLFRDAQLCQLLANQNASSVFLALQVLMSDSGSPVLTEQHQLSISIKLSSVLSLPSTVRPPVSDEQALKPEHRANEAWNATCSVLSVLLAAALCVIMLLAFLLAHSRRLARDSHSPSTLARTSSNQANGNGRSVSWNNNKNNNNINSKSRPIKVNSNSNGTSSETSALRNGILKGGCNESVVSSVCVADGEPNSHSPRARARRLFDPDYICEQATWNA